MRKVNRSIRKQLAVFMRKDLPVQTMTTTRALDIEATVAELIRLSKAGAEAIRVTVPTIKDAEALAEITKRYYKIRGKRDYPLRPIVADIHFSPEAALIAARYVTAVRINPGNYINPNIPKNVAEELEIKAQARKVFGKLIDVLKLRFREHYLRIGVNHGSLSPRIVAKYGAGSLGMVESAIEFLEFACEKNFQAHTLISLKASDVQQMVFANRLLRKRILELKCGYIMLHLGVTEAGAGEEARIKSAIGIGALLVDGIGHTIRVSLTEDPVAEIKFGQLLRAYIKEIEPFPSARRTPRHKHIKYYDPPVRLKRNVHPALREFSKGLVFAKYPTFLYKYEDEIMEISEEALRLLGFNKSEEGKWEHTVESVDGVLCSEYVDLDTLPSELSPYFLKEEEIEELYVSVDKKWSVGIVPPEMFNIQHAKLLYPSDHKRVILVRSETKGPAAFRLVGNRTLYENVHYSVAFWQPQLAELEGDELLVAMGVDYGTPLLDDYGNGIMIEGAHFEEAKRAAFMVLQSLGLRRTKAEFVACPGCGRTLFDLQSTFERVRRATEHLRHLKIAVMGCIVNGPGEMGDADYGYVGAGPGKITLYRRGKIVKRNIPEGEAIEALLTLIKDSGDFIVQEENKPSLKH